MLAACSNALNSKGDETCITGVTTPKESGFLTSASLDFVDLVNSK